MRNEVMRMDELGFLVYEWCERETCMHNDFVGCWRHLKMDALFTIE